MIANFGNTEWEAGESLSTSTLKGRFVDTAERQDPPILSIENYSKSFGSFRANDNISLSLNKGEVLCLLGENGAGKSTLCKCLYGAYKPDCGTLRIEGKQVELNSPKDAIDLGIGMVHQHFVLVPPLSVVENIIVGSEKHGFFSRLEPARKRIRELCASYDLDLDPDAIVRDLSVGQQQWVEILKAMYTGVKVLILDEPTATLTPQETERLFAVVKKMVANGMSVILITHKLHEVMGSSHRVVVLKKGQVAGTCITAEVTKKDLVQLMVGRNVEFTVNHEPAQYGRKSLWLEHVTLEGPFSVPVLNNISFAVRQGEIFGVAGIAGNGQKELYDVVVGMSHIDSGSIGFGDEDMTSLSPASRSDMGLAQVPPDRIDQGLLMEFPVSQNMILGFQRSPRFRNKLLDPKKIADFSEESIKKFDIASSGADQKVRELSGGNLQKVILARELAKDISIIVASSPTRGLDVGAIEYVHNRLLELRRKGTAVLLISEDLDEIMNLSDRIGVMFRGRLMGIFDRENAVREQIGLKMAGVEETTR